MLKAENNVKGQNNTYPWSPELHDTVRSVSIWKAKLTQHKTKVSHLNQIEYLTKSMQTPIDISWKDPSELKRNLREATKELKKIRRKAKELRKLHLSKRASAMNISNKSLSEKNNHQYTKNRTSNSNVEKNQIPNKTPRKQIIKQ